MGIKQDIRTVGNLGDETIDYIPTMGPKLIKTL